MANIEGTSGNDVLTGTDDADVINGLGGDDVIDGKFGADILNGGSGNDKFVFSGVRFSTSDSKVGLIDGGEGFDIIDWSNISPITLGTIKNDAGSYVLGAYVGSQKFEIRGVEAIKFGETSDWINLPSDSAGLQIFAGSGSDDIFTYGGNRIYAEAGDDKIFISGAYSGSSLTGLVDGGAGNDTLTTNIGFTVDLATGTATSGNAQYQVSNFEILEMSLSGYAATGLGDGQANIMRINTAGGDDGRAGVTFDGRGGDDYISGGAGNDVLRGGDGIDTVSYEYAKAGVRIDLATGLATGGAGRDTLSGFEIVVGSAYGDTIIGNEGRNTLSGGAGDDTIVTVGGFAAIRTGGGFDRVDGGSGVDTLMLGGVQSDYHLLSSGSRTLMVTARGATDVTGVEQIAFFNTHAQSLSGVLGGTAAFDGLSYIAGYADLRAAFGTDAAKGTSHFLDWGFNEGRGLTFNALDYIASYGDLIKAYGADSMAGAKHFIEWGATEGRGATFNGWAYLASYGDLIQAFGANESAGAKHFIEWGSAEGRGITFNAAVYAANYADLAAAFGNDAEALARHYVLYGYAEGRTFAPLSTSISASGGAVMVLSDKADRDVLATAPAAIEPAAQNTVSPAVFVTDQSDIGQFLGKGWADVSEIHANIDNLVIA